MGEEKLTEKEQTIKKVGEDLRAYINAERHFTFGAMVAAIFLGPLALIAIVGAVRGSYNIVDLFGTSITIWVLLIIGVVALIYAISAYFIAKVLRKPAYDAAEAWIHDQVQQELEEKGIIDSTPEGEA